MHTIKKDTTASIRINQEIKDVLKKRGITPQKIIDLYISAKWDSFISKKIKKKVKNEQTKVFS